MRAAYYEAFGGPENLRLGEQPGPDAGHLLVRVAAAGVGVWDVGMMSGRVGQGPLPRIPGCEVAGTVESPAGGFRAGDRVFGSLFSAGGGGFAEIAAMRPDKAAAIPDGTGFPEAAALVIPGVTAYQGLVELGELKAGEAVLITAASGGVGSAAVQIAAHIGARVVAVASARNHDYVRGLGAGLAVDYHDPDYAEQLHQAVPDGFDLLFDGTGNEVRDQVAALVRAGGRGIFIIGGTPPQRAGVTFQYFGASTTTARLEAIAALVASGALRMPIEAELPLDRARQAVEQVAARHTVGRVVLRIGS